MFPSPLRLNIRHAKPEDFGAIGNLHASAMTHNQLYKALYGNIDPDVARQWLWVGNAATGVAKGRDTLLVLENSETTEIICFVYFWKYDKNRKLELADPKLSPVGYNNELGRKLTDFRTEWQQELLKEFGEFVCGWLFSSGRHFSYTHHFEISGHYSIHIDIGEMAIVPCYQSHGLGRVLLRHVLALAERDHLNLALTAGKGP